MELKKNPEFEIGRNSSLYFSIGLCIMLFVTYNLLEYKTYDNQDIAIDILQMNEELEEDIPLLNIDVPPPPPPPKVAPIVISIIDDIVEIEETIIESTEMNQEDVIEDVEISDIYVDEVEEDIVVPFAAVEGPPVYPGCEGLPKAELKDCFQAKIQQHIKNNFRYPPMAIERGLNGKVFVLFVIDAEGRASNIRTRGPDKILEKEAHRIINILPKMKPGNQRGRAVAVAYALPIHFKFITQ